MSGLRQTFVGAICAGIEWLKISRVVCTVMVASLLALLSCMLWISFRYDSDQNPFILHLNGHEVNVSAVVDSIGFGWIGSILAVLLTFVLFVSPQRNGAIRALHSGYVSNFLLKIVPSANIGLIVFDPGPSVLSVTEGGLLRDKQDSDWVHDIEERGFLVHEELRGAPGDTRKIYVVRHPTGRGEIGVDFARNLFALRALIEAEQTWLVDRICSTDHKFRVLSRIFYRGLRDVVNSNAAMQRRVDLIFGFGDIDEAFEELILTLREELGVIEQDGLHPTED